LGGDRLDGREHVLNAMVEFRNQRALLLLHPFALGYVDADADHSVWASVAAIGNETARFDPTHLATSTNDTILYAIFAPARAERLAAELFHPPYVVGVHASQAFGFIPTTEYMTLAWFSSLCSFSPLPLAVVDCARQLTASPVHVPNAGKRPADEG